MSYTVVGSPCLYMPQVLVKCECCDFLFQMLVRFEKELAETVEQLSKAQDRATQAESDRMQQVLVHHARGGGS